MASKTHSKSHLYTRFEGEMITLKVREGKCTSKDSASDRDHELIIDFKQPLQEVMRAVCSHHGRLIMAFPSGSSVKIKFTNYHYGREGDQDNSEVGAHYPDIRAELVEIFVETVPTYKEQIKNKLEHYGYHPSDDDIKVVKLVSSAGDEALSVDLEDKRVYFKGFKPNTQDLDDTSIFIRVIIDHDGSTMMIWINLSTLLPIARDDNNNLYTVVPQYDIQASINSQQRSIFSQMKQDEPPNDPFHWLDSILCSPDYYAGIYFFYEDGAGSGHVEIRPIKDPPEISTQGKTMICKEAAEINANAIIGTSLMQFTIHHYHFKETGAFY